MLLDVLFKTRECGFNCSVRNIECSPGILEQSFGFPVNLDGCSRRGLAEFVERDYAGVGNVALNGGPRNAIVGDLLGDDRIELALVTAIVTVQWFVMSSVCVTSSTMPRNSGNDSNCVHWL